MPASCQGTAVRRSEHRAALHTSLAASTNPRNRANRHWRWRAYQDCRARSLVRLARVASIVGALSERDAGPPVTRRSCLRLTLTK